MSWQDFRFAFRQMEKQPGFALVAVIVLALGIGCTTAVFSVLYQSLLKPLPYPDAQRLLFVHNAFPKGQVSSAGVSGFDYGEIRKHTDVFASSGIFYWNDLTLTGVGSAQHINVVNASASLFDVLGVKPEMGRVFSKEEDQRGADGRALLSDGLWRGAFGGDPNIAGRVIHLNGTAFTVIGVMPRSFQFPSHETQLWIPVALKQGEFTIEGGRTEKWLHMVARLSAGTSVRKADAALAAISDNLSSRFPAFYPKQNGWHFTQRPLADEQTQRIRRWLYLAFGAVFSVLLIACINVSGLLLIRGTARLNEIAVRLAVGATRSRIVSQMMTETGVLTLVGCALGVLVAAWGIHLVNVFGPMPQPTPFWSWAMLFAPALALLSTCLAGIVPALAATRTTKTRSGGRMLIVAAQIALAVVILFTAVQMNRSFLNLTRVPPGFQTRRIWTGAVDLPNHNKNFFEPLLDALASMPGVESASGGPVPFNPSGIWNEVLQLPGHPKQNPPAEAQIGLAFPGYFETIGIPLLRGRTFTDRDNADRPRVAIIDEELARRYFAGEDAVGKLIASGGANTLATIVGVVGSVHNGDLGGPREPEVYYPALQERTEGIYLVLRMRGDVDPTVAVRSAIAKLDPGVALYDVQFMEARVAASLELRRFVAFLLNGLAITGLVLAAVGLYGSLAHLVQLRYREIGIRVAIGATRPQVLRLILIRAGMVVGLGLLVGAFGATLASRAVQSQLFGVQLMDAANWIGAFGTIVLVGVLAGYVPAWRATQIDPSVALRHE